MKTLVSALSFLILLTATDLATGQDRPAPIISSFTIRPASGRAEVLIGEEAVMEFEYAHIPGGLARAATEVEFCVAGTKICMPSSDWQLSQSDLAKYPDESGKVIVRRRVTGTRKQDLVYELRITDAEGRKVSRKAAEPLRLRLP